MLWGCLNLSQWDEALADLNTVVTRLKCSVLHCGFCRRAVEPHKNMLPVISIFIRMNREYSMERQLHSLGGSKNTFLQEAPTLSYKRYQLSPEGSADTFEQEVPTKSYMKYQPSPKAVFIQS